MGDWGGAATQQGLMAEALGLAMARRAAGILDRHRDVLAGRGIMPVSYAEWLRIETAEAELAQSLGRGERVKLPGREAIWSACRPGRHVSR